MTSAPSSNDRLLIAAVAVFLVVAAFGAASMSSTGIRLVGDGADYAAIAEAGELTGRAPFVYRPAVPLLVGTLFGGNLLLGFSLVCAAAMFLVLYGTASLAPDRIAGVGMAVVLLLNYQVLFNAANPARLDSVVLALQVGFVALALRGKADTYLLLMPLVAPVKESLLLSLGALALLALPRDRNGLLKLTASTAGFVTIHAVIRAVSTPSSFMPPYNGGAPSAEAIGAMLASNLSAFTPLDFFVAWAGLTFVVVAVLGRPSGPAPSGLSPLLAATLLLFPLPLVTDVHRAWFELLAPLALFSMLPALDRSRNPTILGALGAATAASALPYSLRAVGSDHLYLMVLQQTVSPLGWVVMATALGLSAAACWRWGATRPPRGEPSNP